MNAMKTVELLRKYNVCQKCGSDALGNGAGSLVITDNIFKRACKCGWSVEVDDSDKPLGGSTYKDDRGWTYFVRAGLGLETYKTFYRKPDKSPGYGEHGYRNTPWRETAGDAQKDLDALALSKKWKEVTN